MSTDHGLEPHNLIADAIDGAEEMHDPLDGLAEKTVADPGAPFMAEALEALGALKKDSRAAFEALRSRLKKAGCRVTALDDAISEETGETGGRGPTQADILIGLARTAELFHTPGLCRFCRPGHKRPSRDLADPLQRLSSLASPLLLRGDRRRTEFGSAAIGTERDRGQGPEWRGVEIDTTGWRLIDKPPLRFRGRKEGSQRDQEGERRRLGHPRNR